MKKFALKLLLFLLIFLAYDKLFLLVANRSADVEVDKRLEYLLKGEINKDLVLIGSSRGSRDIMANQIEEHTGLSTYNLCYPGSDVVFHDFIMQTLLEFNEAPALMVLVVDDSEAFVDGGARILFRRDRLYPLVKYPYVWKEMAKRGYLDKDLAGLVVLQRLNKYNFDLRQKSFTPIDTIIDCGSMPVSWQQKGLDWEYSTLERSYPLDLEIQEKVEAFQNMIRTCEEKDIQLLILFPPNFRTHSQAFEDRVRFLGGQHPHFRLYDTENPAYRDKEYYYDTNHLMRNGADIYTEEVIAYINELAGH
jgi:hypothetical protein